MKTSRRHEQRSRLRIIYDILRVIGEEEEARPTRIMYKANLSYDRLQKYLRELTRKGLIVEEKTEDRMVYRLTKKGFKALNEIRNIERLLESLGLSF